jgi:hypothetical protein
MIHLWSLYGLVLLPAEIRAHPPVSAYLVPTPMRSSHGES